MAQMHKKGPQKVILGQKANILIFHPCLYSIILADYERETSRRP